MGNDSSRSSFTAIRLGFESDSASAVVHANYARLDPISFIFIMGMGKLGKFFVAKLQLSSTKDLHSDNDSTESDHCDNDSTVDFSHNFLLGLRRNGYCYDHELFDHNL